MWEQTLSVSSNESVMLDYIYSKISSQVKFVGGLIIKVNLKDRSKLTFAVPKKQKDYFVLLILELVSEIITLDYKYDYLENRLGHYIKNELTKSAFLKALTISENLIR